MNTHSRASAPIRPRCTPGRVIRSVKILAVCVVLTACTTSKPISTPMLDTRNPELKTPHRVEAAEIAWATARQDPELREKARAVYKSLVWSTETPRPLRLKLVEFLLLDESPDGEADSRRFTMLRLPTEPDRAVVGMMALAAARNGWAETAPSLVRRLAEPVDRIADEERVEAQALRLLTPGKTLERIVFDIFADPGASGGPSEINWTSRVQADAWTLLSRLDPGGRARRSLILDPGMAAMGESGPLLRDMRAAVDDLGVVPSTAMELDWLRSLRDPSNQRNAAWWREVTSLVASLSDAQRARLELRHLEPIRLASHKSPRLLRTTRKDLIALLEERLDGRPRHRRTAELDGIRKGVRERLDIWADAMSWGDLLGVAVIDDAVRAPGVADALSQQAALDRDDRKTEYGGVLEAVNAADGRVGSFRVVLFPPRPRDRVSDERFVASRDMIGYSDRALAHYHMQVQRDKNYKFAGPSGGDFRYARMSGRNCVVFTSVGKGRLGIDYYQPDGVVIDLGETAVPRR